MNKIRTIKTKTNGETGLFNKLTKRYSNIKFIRSAPIRNGNGGGGGGGHGSPQPTISSGSYDMSGRDSDDLKREIGAPILISKTSIDTDATDCCSQNVKHRELNQHSVQNGKQCNNSTLNKNNNNNGHRSSIPDLGEIKFSFLSADDHIDGDLNFNLTTYDSPPSPPPLSPPPAPPPPPQSQSLPQTMLIKNRSKSATNLHKSEIKVFLQRAPSLEFDGKLSTIDEPFIESSYDMPKRLNEYRQQFTSNDGSIKSCNKNEMKIDGENEQFLLVANRRDENSPEYFHEYRKKLRCSESRDSFCANSSGNNSFDMKSASFQSLDARNLFLSIEELNEITRQINESEEFNYQHNSPVDLEYCEHRDKLKPDQRRITLLRNRNASVMDLERKKEKLSNAWSGLKTWLGEEREKLKDVVQKHAAMQRVGGNINEGAPQCAKIEQNTFDTGLTPVTTTTTPSPTTTMSSNGYYKKIKFPTKKYSPTKIKLFGKSSNASEPSNVVQQANLSTDSNIMDDDRLSDISELNDLKRIPSSKGCNGVMDENCNQSRAQSRMAGSLERDSVPKFIQAIVRKGSASKTGETQEGQNGFEELRRYVKQGGDFGKELVSILQERVDAEQLYAKSLSKMAAKLSKACREIPGTIADSWRGVATEMESRSEVHRQFSNSMIEEIVKPLKAILDNQHKTRKSIEGTVDKSSRILSEWRTAESKAKKTSHTAARENEKLQDAMLDVRIQRSPSVVALHHNKSPDKDTKNAEKDCVKLDNKRRKAEESVKRADVDYYTLCVRAERARVEWELSVLRGSSILQNHENQRLSNLKNYVADYVKFSNQMNPSIMQLMDRLAPYVSACNAPKDLSVVKNIRRATEGPSEQLLPDFYCEHTTLAMNRERRKHALVKLLQLVRTDLERERKSRNGLKGLSQSLTTPENQNITDKLYHIRSMLTYLEGARFKLQSALLELDHKPRGAHPLAPHIQITRDRTGLQQSILKVPHWLKNGDGDDQIACVDYSDYDLDIGDLSTQPDAGDSDSALMMKHFDRNGGRNKSGSEFSQRKKEIIVLTNNNNIIGKGTMISNKSDSPTFDRGIADGGSNQPDSDFDEFSSQDEEDDLSKKPITTTTGTTTTTTLHRMGSIPQTPSPTGPPPPPPPPLPLQPPPSIVISRCRALYNYYPKLYDELELNPGDLIDVHAKQEDGWWLGAIKNKIGIFPATYVEEIV